MFESIRGHTIYAAGLTRDPTVLDVGANRGEFSRQLRKRFGGRYCLVEANPVLADGLATSSDFRVVQCAVAARDGEVEFHVNRNDEASTVLEFQDRERLAGSVRETIRIKSRGLEGLIAELALQRIDLLKMDIEGAEVGVLESVSESTLRNIGQISVEFHSAMEFGFDLREPTEAVIRRLRDCGFLFLDFSFGTRCDVLFINKSWHAIPWHRQWLWRARVHAPRWVRGAWNAIAGSGLRRILNRMTGIDRSR